MDGAAAWIDDWPMRPAFDSRLHGLLVGRVTQVRYVEIAGTTVGAPGALGDDFDSIDYGIEIDYADGRIIGLIWQLQGSNEGVLIFLGELRPRFVHADADVRVWDVSTRWRRKGGNAIVAVDTVWSRSAYGPGIDATGEIISLPRVSDYQLDGVRLRWDTDRESVILRGERNFLTKSWQFNPTNVSVFFSVREAQNAGVRLEDLIAVD